MNYHFSCHHFHLKMMNFGLKIIYLALKMMNSRAAGDREAVGALPDRAAVNF